MAVSLADYVGREQAYVKHVFLQEYLEALIHKTASTYLDGIIPVEAKVARHGTGCKIAANDDPALNWMQRIAPVA